MAKLPKNGLLELPSNAVDEIRIILNLHKPGRLEEALYILEEWIKKQDHLLKKDFDREYLGRALLACKGSVEKAKKQIDRLCTMKTLMPHFFVVTNVKEDLKQMLEIAWVIPLPKVTQDFHRVLLVKINDKSFTEQNYLEYYQYSLIMCEYLKDHDYVYGYVVVHDYRQMNILELVTKMNVVQLQQFMTIAIEGYGARMKEVHIISKSKIVDLFVKIVKQVIPEKLRNRVYVHKTLEELYEMVPKDILPVEYGGKERPISELREMWIDELSKPETEDYIKMMFKARTDETKRRSDKFNEEYMGTPGAFRHLSVD